MRRNCPTFNKGFVRVQLSRIINHLPKYQVYLILRLHPCPPVVKLCDDVTIARETRGGKGRGSTLHPGPVSGLISYTVEQAHVLSVVSPSRLLRQSALVKIHIRRHFNSSSITYTAVKLNILRKIGDTDEC